jgi:hypothetical protein
VTDRKFQIFVSSTYEDLKREREAVSKAILELGHIPVGMEMFSAADEQQWQLIRRQIEQSDYYIAIVAHRYGSLAGDVSYTEREYDYAIENGVPVLGFVIDDRATWLPEYIDKDSPSIERLEAFKGKIKSRMVSIWSNADQLSAQVLAALSKAFAAAPRPGWVRAINIPGPEVLSELSRLSKENAELRARVGIEATPEFEILYANLIQSGDQYRVQMIVLAHYSGAPLYVPSSRYSLTADFDGTSRGLKTMLNGSSPLIRAEGDDLQIEGSGYFNLISIDTISAKNLGQHIGLALDIHLRSHFGIVLRVNLSAPDWSYGKAL